MTIRIATFSTLLLVSAAASAQSNRSDFELPIQYRVQDAEHTYLMTTETEAGKQRILQHLKANPCSLVAFNSLLSKVKYHTSVGLVENWLNSIERMGRTGKVVITETFSPPSSVGKITPPQKYVLSLESKIRPDKTDTSLIEEAASTEIATAYQGFEGCTDGTLNINRDFGINRSSDLSRWISEHSPRAQRDQAIADSLKGLR